MENKTSGTLKVGDEVTCYGEIMPVGKGDKEHWKINRNSFWGKITGACGDSVYKVIDKNGIAHRIERADLRHRKRYTLAVGHVSEDKKHDRHAMQHFTTKELEWLEAYMNENFPNHIPGCKILIFHTHSDNASQHFKNTGAMNYYTTLIGKQGGRSDQGGFHLQLRRAISRERKVERHGRTLENKNRSMNHVLDDARSPELNGQRLHRERARRAYGADVSFWTGQGRRDQR